jgi:hypothetical protein
MRTFSQADWNAAQEAWTDFSPEWKAVRHQAAMRGILFPPSGSKWDSWEDDSPSQRAILIRAIREHPTLLRECVARSSSWSQVIDRLITRIAAWREDVAEREVEAARRHADEMPRRSEPQSIASILDRIADSAGVER